MNEKTIEVMNKLIAKMSSGGRMAFEEYAKGIRYESFVWFCFHGVIACILLLALIGVFILFWKLLKAEKEYPDLGVAFMFAIVFLTILFFASLSSAVTRYTQMKTYKYQAVKAFIRDVR
jgi:succinate dehydrogenase/fumarate reductase cytochrome b subunit